MRVAIYAPGPSLRFVSGYDESIAVNRAAIAGHFSWWSVGDSETWHRYARDIKGASRVWTHAETWRRIEPHAQLWGRGIYERSERHKWTLYSATAALMLAADLGAESIDCYGCDMAGALNFDGTEEATADRTEARWARERQAWAEAVDLLDDRGITVTRM